MICDCPSRRSSSSARRPQSPAFLLESAEQGQRVGATRSVGVGRARSSGGRSATTATRTTSPPARSAATARPTARPPAVVGGAVGYFSYDLVRTVEPLGDPNPNVLACPDMPLRLSDVLVVFDHLNRISRSS